MSATLLIMAAGMGSRYGGSKQVDAMGPHGEILMEYSIYDAVEAGFTKVVFVLKNGMEESFHENFGRKIARKVEVSYAFQTFESLPDNYKVPENRVKPYGTVHAVLCAKDLINEPFAVINADDFYGKESFQIMYGALQNLEDVNDSCMVGYYLKNTVSKNGHVTRGVCSLNADKTLKGIEETYEIRCFPDRTIRDTFNNPDGKILDSNCVVSMNFFGFTPWIFDMCEKYLSTFLKNTDPANIKSEYVLPTMVDELMHNENMKVAVLPTEASWFGVTYKEDKPTVVAHLQSLHNDGSYPENLML